MFNFYWRDVNSQPHPFRWKSNQIELIAAHSVLYRRTMYVVAHTWYLESIRHRLLSVTESTINTQLISNILPLSNPQSAPTNTSINYLLCNLFWIESIKWMKKRLTPKRAPQPVNGNAYRSRGVASINSDGKHEVRIIFFGYEFCKSYLFLFDICDVAFSSYWLSRFSEFGLDQILKWHSLFMRIFSSPANGNNDK